MCRGSLIRFVYLAKPAFSGVSYRSCGGFHPRVVRNPAKSRHSDAGFWWRIRNPLFHHSYRHQSRAPGGPQARQCKSLPPRLRPRWRLGVRKDRPVHSSDLSVQTGTTKRTTPSHSTSLRLRPYVPTAVVCAARQTAGSSTQGRAVWPRLPQSRAASRQTFPSQSSIRANAECRL